MKALVDVINFETLQKIRHFFIKDSVKKTNVDFNIVKEIISLYPDRVYKNIYNGGLMKELV